MAVSNTSLERGMELRQEGFEAAVKSRSLNLEIESRLQEDSGKCTIFVAYDWRTKELRVSNTTAIKAFEIGILKWDYYRESERVYNELAAFTEDGKILEHMVNKHPQFIHKTRCWDECNPIFEETALTATARLKDVKDSDISLTDPYFVEIFNWVVSESPNHAFTLFETFSLELLEIVDDKLLSELINQAYSREANINDPSFPALIDYAEMRNGLDWVVDVLESVAQKSSIGRYNPILRALTQRPELAKRVLYKGPVYEAFAESNHRMSISHTPEDVGHLFDEYSFCDEVIKELFEHVAPNPDVIVEWVDYGVHRFGRKLIVKSVYASLIKSDWDWARMYIMTLLDGIKASSIADTLEGVYENHMCDLRPFSGLKIYVSGSVLNTQSLDGTLGHGLETADVLPNPETALEQHYSNELVIGLSYKHHLNFLREYLGDRKNDGLEKLQELIHRGEVPVIHPDDIVMGQKITIQKSLVDYGEVEYGS